MTASAPPSMTERQAQWFKALQDGLERETGKSLADWAEIARACPESKPRARLKWLKAEHGLGQSRGMLIFAHAFPPEGPQWDDPEGLITQVWADAGKRAIFEAVRTVADALPGSIMAPRKSYTPFSRSLQYLAARPVRDGVRVGLGLDPATDPRLSPAKPSEAWSERLTASTVLARPGEVDASLRKLIKMSWQNA